MSTKTVTLSQDAYDLLSNMKQPRESFSDVVRRIVPHKSIMEFAGTITAEDANRWKKEIARGRQLSRSRARVLE